MATIDEPPRTTRLGRPGWRTWRVCSAQVAGAVFVDGDEGYSAEHTGFDLSVPPRPALIVGGWRRRAIWTYRSPGTYARGLCAGGSATGSTSVDDEWMVFRLLVPTGACRNPMIAGVLPSWSSLVTTSLS